MFQVNDKQVGLALSSGGFIPLFAGDEATVTFKFKEGRVVRLPNQAPITIHVGDTFSLILSSDQDSLTYRWTS